MREGIHPAYYQAKVVCNCGNEFVTGSTKEEIHVEICSKCHPFYTGQQKATSARGRMISSTRNTAYRTINFSYLQRLRLYASAFFVMERIYEDFRYWWPGCY